MTMSGYEKAAIFLSSVGEDVAAQILKDLAPQDIGKISSYMAKSRKKDNNKLESVLTEIMEKVKGGEIGVGGEDYVKKLLTKGLGGDDAEKIMEMVSKKALLSRLSGSIPGHCPVSDLRASPDNCPDSLSDGIRAGSGSNECPAGARAGRCGHEGSSNRKDPDSALEEIEAVLKGQLDMGKGRSGKSFQGTKVIAEILNQCERSTEQSILRK